MKILPNTKKVTFYFGTKAEFIKIFPVINKLSLNGFDIEIIHSGQNNMDDVELLSLSKIDKKNIKSLTDQPKQTTLSLVLWFIKTFFITFIFFFKSDKQLIIVHGDTLSTLIGALAGRLNGHKVAHVEAGLRSFNFMSPFPEEISRVFVSYVANYHFAPNKWALTNLKNSRGEKINTINNTLLESMHVALKKNTNNIEKIISQDEKYFIFIVHRQENILNRKVFTSLIEVMLNESKLMKCIFVLHKPTEEALNKLPYLKNEIYNNKNISVHSRFTYSDMIHLIDGSEFIVTDGGSNQEECFYLGKPCLLLRKNTERIEGLNLNVLLSNLDLDVIKKFFLTYKKYKKNIIKTKDMPSDLIYESILKINKI